MTSALPPWVWDLLEALDQYEDEHPALHFEHFSGEYKRWHCFGSVAQDIVPRDVMETAAVMRARREAAS